MELPGLKAIEESQKKARERTGAVLSPWPLLYAGIALFFLALIFFPSAILQAVSIAFFLSPLWVPILIVGAAWTLWVILKRSEFIASQNYTLLEIKPPRSLVRTPLAMETVLSGLHHGPGEGNWYQRYFKGGVRPYWSLEIASLEGQVHFFIWTRTNFRRLIEAQIYAQYPGAQLTEVQDYTRMISAKTPEWRVWGCDFIKTKADPYPLKTYVEYGLEKVQKEPEQVDPLSNLIEFMASLGKSEYLWLQLVIRVHKGEKQGAGKTWKDEGKKIVEDMRKATRTPYIDPTTGKEMPGFPNPTKGESETMAAIERNVAKLAFDVGVRGIYISNPPKFDPVTISGLTGIFKHFSTEGWNGLRPIRWLIPFPNYPWQGKGNERLQERARRGVVDAFRRRQFFYNPHATHDYPVMSTEEIATIFHIPSAAVESPALPRIQSATGEAPVNLPT